MKGRLTVIVKIIHVNDKILREINEGIENEPCYATKSTERATICFRSCVCLGYATINDIIMKRIGNEVQMGESCNISPTDLVTIFSYMR